MSHIFIINAHQPSDFSEGRLNATLAEKAKDILTAKGHALKTTASAEAYDVEEELAKHEWADAILLQSPVNWMGVPWSFKKYMDDIYTAGMQGALCDGDGRTSSAPKQNYGAGGTLDGTKYMLSLTFNAPAEAFDTPQEYLFQGKSVDDLLFPMHMNFRFFGMTPLPTFAAFDVIKDPHIAEDLDRFEEHLTGHF